MSTSTLKPASVRSLTSRQLEVLELIAMRLTIKEIAARLEVTESAVNQRIRSLKERLGVNSQRALAEAYADLTALERAHSIGLQTCSKSTCSKNQLPDEDATPQLASQGEQVATLVFSDVSTFEVHAPWERPESYMVAPGMLNGQSAFLHRTGAVFMLAILMMALVVLGVTVGEVLSGLGTR
jgi:DNA-binding CsgD family transcriptional regulator